MKRLALSLLLLMSLSTPALGWGHLGHLFISAAGARAFPASLPSFVRTPEAIAEIRDLGPELDASKNAGNPHDADRDPGHYVDIGDDGTIDGIALGNLPRSRERYDDALRRVGSDQYKTGFLPYTLIDGWQQVVKDFAFWRVAAAGETKSTDPRERAFFAAERKLRETLTLRDIGVWSHYVGDASQPLHASARFNGWVERYPNSKGIHARFETSFVHAHVTLAQVIAHVPAYRPCGCSIEQYVARYLAATNAQVIPLYELGAKTGSFRGATPEAIEFTVARIAAGAAALRDLVAEAWTASLEMKVGYPGAQVRDLLNGSAPLTRGVFGDD